MNSLDYHYSHRTITSIAEWDSSAFGSAIELIQSSSKSTERGRTATNNCLDRSRPLGLLAFWRVHSAVQILVSRATLRDVEKQETANINDVELNAEEFASHC